MMDDMLCVDIQPQPTEVTCGPTCLHAVYRYYGDSIPLEQIIEEVPMLEAGGTLAAMLGSHALQRGYKATIYTCNIEVFDPTWFEPKLLNSNELAEKLRLQAGVKQKLKLQLATHAYLKFLELGGQILMKDLSPTLVRHYLSKKCPILTGLSSTFLYHASREYGAALIPDDIRGDPEGHFVILSGYNSQTKEICVSDPFQRNPYSQDLKYNVKVDRVICSILLGILTYDANFLIVEKPSAQQAT